MKSSDRDKSISLGSLYGLPNLLLSYRALKWMIWSLKFSINFMTLNITFEPLFSVIQNKWCAEMFLGIRDSSYLFVETYSISSKRDIFILIWWLSWHLFFSLDKFIRICQSFCLLLFLFPYSGVTTSCMRYGLLSRPLKISLLNSKTGLTTYMPSKWCSPS